MKLPPHGTIFTMGFEWLRVVFDFSDF